MAIRLAFELEAYNRSEKQNQISKVNLRVSNAEDITPTITSVASETLMEPWMKSMEANMDALTNKIKQLKIREPIVKFTKETQVTNQFVVMNVTRKVITVQM